MITRTPLIPFDARISLKAENLQPDGSYKIRGVVEAVRRADPERLRFGLSAASAGNMAQPVARVARERGLYCRIFLPESAPPVKKAAIRALGAEIIELPFAEVWEMVRDPRLAPREGVFFHPTRTPGLVEGYGRIVDEILEDAPDADAIVVPYGVGGLSLGIARRVREIGARIDVLTCEPATAAPMHASLAARRPVAVERQGSFVDAIGTPEVLPDVYDALAPLLRDALVVSLHEVRKAMHALLFEKKLVTEGAGAAGFAGALQLADRSSYRRIVGIVSGGNITPTVLRELMASP